MRRRARERERGHYLNVLPYQAQHTGVHGGITDADADADAAAVGSSGKASSLAISGQNTWDI